MTETLFLQFLEAFLEHSAIPVSYLWQADHFAVLECITDVTR